MVEVDASTLLTGPSGKLTLLEAFEGRRQLVVYYIHVAPRPPGVRAMRGLHVLHHAGQRAVRAAFPRHHLRGLLPGPLRRKRPYYDFMGWNMPWYSAQA